MTEFSFDKIVAEYNPGGRSAFPADPSETAKALPMNAHNSMQNMKATNFFMEQI
jgi:hypothetical protein